MGAKAMLIGWVLTALLAVTASANKPPVKPTLMDLATVWVGGSPGYGLEYLRLELDPAGKGFLTVQWLPNKPATAYRVTETKLSGYQVEFVLEPIDDPNESLYLRGEALRSFMDLEAGSAKPKWKQRVAMQPYASLLSRLQAVTDRAQTLREKLP